MNISNINNIDKKLSFNACRCCLADVCYKDISNEYSCSGQREVYEEMLKDVFDIEIPYQMCGGPSTSSRLICEDCISKLRDAKNFKDLVMQSKKSFMQFLEGIQLNVKTEEIQDTDFNSEEVKIKSEPEYDNEPEIKEKIEGLELVDKNESRKVKDNEILDDIKLELKKDINEMLIEATHEIKKRKSKETGAANKRLKASDGHKTRRNASREAAGNFTLTEDVNGTIYFSCNTCTERFKSRDLYIQHYTHAHLQPSPRLRKCNLCHIKFPPHLRADHFEKAHGVPAPTCAECGKKFAFHNQVIWHQKVDHMGEKEYQCDCCSKKFPTRSDLEKHKVVTHLPFKKFACSYCNKGFKLKRNMKTHMRLHENIRPHVCTICQKAYVQPSSLKIHMCKKHADVKG